MQREYRRSFFVIEYIAMWYAMLVITAKMENIEKQKTVVPENMYP